MSNPKFTPGPWRIEGTSSYVDGDIESKAIVGDGWDIAAVPEDIPELQGGHNAHLSAKAPEMHDVGMELAMLVLQSDLYENSQVRDAVDNALAVYAAARGEE